MAERTEDYEDFKMCSYNDQTLILEQKKQDEKEKRDLMKSKLAQEILQFSRTAEVNRHFIVGVFTWLREGMVLKYPKFNKTKFDELAVSLASVDSIPLEFKGLYLIYKCFNGEKFPFYIGYTGQSFRARFRSHRDYGAINVFLNKYPNAILMVDLIPTFFPMHAKLLESVFLLSFDFCLNKEENEAVREKNYDCQPNQINISRRYFDVAYNVISGEVGYLNEFYQKWQQ